MTQTTNRFFDEMARLMNDAAGVASGVRREFDTNGDLLVRHMAVPDVERQSLVAALAKPSWLDPATGGPRK